jgi:hypothetical protein
MLDQRGETLDGFADCIERIGVVVEQIVNGIIDPAAERDDLRHENLDCA